VLLLLAALKPGRHAAAPRAFVPLASDLSAPSCDWRSTGPLAGARPADEAALAAAVLRTEDSTWLPAGGAPSACDQATCFVAVRSAPVFMSVGAVSFAASSAGEVRRSTRACCERT
jgi:hypothetical protein